MNDILTINDRDILENAGRVRKKIADEIAGEEYEKYKEKRRLVEKIKDLESLEDEIKLIGKKKK